MDKHQSNLSTHLFLMATLLAVAALIAMFILTICDAFDFLWYRQETANPNVEHIIASIINMDIIDFALPRKHMRIFLRQSYHQT